MVERGDVLILDNELHGETTANRLPRVAKARDLSAEMWADHLWVENMRGRWADVFSLAPYFESIDPGRFRVIILDAFYRFLPPDTDENDNGTVAGIYNQLDKYAARLGCGFVLIHHSSKGSQADKAITEVGAGAGAQSRAADTHLILRAHEEKDVVVMDAATRSWPPIDPVCLRWDFPVWSIDPTLDPTLLRKSGRQRNRAAAQPSGATKDAPVWDVDRLVKTFITAEPHSKPLICARAREAGVPVRQIDNLLLIAEADHKVYRWTFPKTNSYKLATREQTILDTGSSCAQDTPLARAPHTPRRCDNALRGRV